jgi:hypothetical protein
MKFNISKVTETTSDLAKYKFAITLKRTVLVQTALDDEPREVNQHFLYSTNKEFEVDQEVDINLSDFDQRHGTFVGREGQSIPVVRLQAKALA